MNTQQFSKCSESRCCLRRLPPVVFFLGRITTDGTATVARHDVSADEGERKVLYWQAPMDPTEIYDGPASRRWVWISSPSTRTKQRRKRPCRAQGPLWQAPMNPEEIYDQPGKSAMGMDLIPVYADEAEAESGSTVSIDQ